MAGALRRILRFRQLAEEQSRLELEREAQLLRRVTAACERQITLERGQRATLAESWTGNVAGQGAKVLAVPDRERADGKGWLMEEAELEFLGWKRMRLEQVRDAELERIEPMIERYTERRRELRQTERLLEQQASLERLVRDRRAQAEADEWFLERRRAGERQAGKGKRSKLLP